MPGDLKTMHSNCLGDLVFGFDESSWCIIGEKLTKPLLQLKTNWDADELH